MTNRFPESEAILYDLARYAAQLGHVDVVRNRLKEAVMLDPGLRQKAEQDPSLQVVVL